ncbi:DUF418 domain-containing protein [Actinomadura sp. WMMB 499]|uniref:DUF418 domain-containing protein n=1 Tax=Actinomadura sp. WMMB 499 TaxID=1219491 RepID=UPI001244B5A0|nr:DUF418 domain-containing protein [Actinomadura sp. WMMB 499]QFG23570.1 DUF418 domain-containing protein [Actinomadura sp. WMMB 499]
MTSQTSQTSRRQPETEPEKPSGTAAAPVRAGRRIAELDALRGLALCGIIFINIPQTLEMFDNAGQLPDVLRVLFLGRFYPIFFLLFGIGFGIFLRSAQRRAARPRSLLLRRFAALGVAGALLHLIQPGEVLLPFAVTGVLVLIPFSYVRGRALAVSGGALTVLGVLAGVGGLGLLPGLFVLGFALADLGVHASLPRSARALAATALGAAATGTAAWALISMDLPDIAQIRLGLAFSLSMATGYAALFLLALRTPAGFVPAWVLGPMGRMALTNYVTAALLFVPIGAALDLRDSAEWTAAALLGLGILAAQALFSNLWLRAFRYGPLEWAWRCVTYWRRLPIRARRELGAA